MTYLKDYYDQLFRLHNMPEFEDLTDEDKEVIAGTFSYHAYALHRSLKELGEAFVAASKMKGILERIQKRLEK